MEGEEGASDCGRAFSDLGSSTWAFQVAHFHTLLNVVERKVHHSILFPSRVVCDLVKSSTRQSDGEVLNWNTSVRIGGYAQVDTYARVSSP